MSSRGASLGWVCLAIGALLGCDDPGFLLGLSVKTDFVPSAEFSSVRVLVSAEDVDEREDRAVTSDMDFVSGVSVAQFEGLPAGSLSVQVQLLGPSGSIVTERPLVLGLTGDRVVTVLVTRDCREVRCPDGGDASLTACLGGRCVDPRCASGADEVCGAAACEIDDDCAAGADCARPICSEGSCLLGVEVGACGADAFCNPEVGCTPWIPPADGGSPNHDGGAVDGGADTDAGADGGADAGGALTACEAGGATAVTTGLLHACAVIAGKLWCWGASSNGQLGLGDTDDRPSPTRVGAASDWTGLAAGETFTCGLRDSGQLFCWGSNSDGQLGIASTAASRPSPARIGMDADWAHVTAGRFHACGLRTDGSLWCWGRNDDGQLGLGDMGSSTDRRQPERVGADSDWAAVGAGGVHTCGVKTTGELYCWGGNLRGQLGQGDDGDGTQRTAPTRVGASSWRTIVTGGKDNAASIRADGTLWSWGANDGAQLGLGGTGDEPTPTQTGTSASWIAVEAGWFHVCGLLSDDSLWCWGSSGSGQVGPGVSGSRQSVPLQIGAASWQAVSAGGDHTCAIDTGGALRCWGSNARGQLGVDGAPGGPTVRRVCPPE